MMLRHLISKKKGISQYFNPTLYQGNDAMPLYITQMMLHHFISKKKGISQYFNSTLYQTNDAKPLCIKESQVRKVRLNLDKKVFG